MTEQTILSRIKSVVFDTFGAPLDSLTGETTAKQVPGWDSLGHLVFITGIEREFGVQLPMEASLSVPDLGGLAALVERSLAG